MCGITGIYHSQEKVDPKWIKHMTDLLRHRGPDDEGYLFFNPAGQTIEERSGDDTAKELKYQMNSIEEPISPYPAAFGHRRLSIIELSYLGHMPMSDSTGNYWIIYNGEIFNYIELREELKQLGYQFKTNSDTEAILASYAIWGTDCVKRFNGDWAFCIYDRIKNILFASRDRFGVRFFYYFWDGKIFAFAS